MEFKFTVPLKKWDSSSTKTAPLNEKSAVATHLTEIHNMVVIEKQKNGKFKLKTGWDTELDSVRCVDSRLAAVLGPDMTVEVHYNRVKKDDPYIRGLSSVTLSPEDGFPNPDPSIAPFPFSSWPQFGCFWWYPNFQEQGLVKFPSLETDTIIDEFGVGEFIPPPRVSFDGNYTIVEFSKNIDRDQPGVLKKNGNPFVEWPPDPLDSPNVAFTFGTLGFVHAFGLYGDQTSDTWEAEYKEDLAGKKIIEGYPNNDVRNNAVSLLGTVSFPEIKNFDLENNNVQGDQIVGWIDPVYTQVVDGIYQFTGITIRERNIALLIDNPRSIASMTIPFPTPVLAHEIVNGNPVRRYYDRHASSIAYDHSTESYTLQTPIGLMWVSRKLLKEGSSIKPSRFVHYNVTPWPDDGISNDPRDKELGIVSKRRQWPWWGCITAGMFAIQGDWRRTGGFRGDTQFFIRLWSRNVRNVWRNRYNIPVTKLAESNVVSDPVTVIGCDTGMDSVWPMSRNQKAWILAASWVAHNFERDFGPSDQRIPRGEAFGWEDSGFTLSAIDPITGNILSKLTIRNEITWDIWYDPAHNRNRQVDQLSEYQDKLIDKYVNHNPDYYPPNSGPTSAPPIYGGYFFRSLPYYNQHLSIDLGNGIWFTHSKVTGFSGIADYPRFTPGPPSFTNVPNVATRAWEDGGFYAYPDEDGGGFSSNDSYNPERPRLIMDEEDHIYTVLRLPTWERQQDDIEGNLSQPWIEKVVVSKITITGGGGMVAGFDEPAFYNWWWLEDELGNICLASDILAVTFNGQDVDWSYYEGPGNGLLQRVTFRHPGPGVRGEEQFPGSGTWVWQFPDGELKTIWKRYEPNPDSNVSLIETYEGAGPFETELFEPSPMPYNGFRTFGYQPKYRQSWVARTMLFLFKFKLEEGKNLVELYRKDITQLFAHSPDQGNDPIRIPMTKIEGQGDVVGTLVLGNYIFVLRTGWRTVPEDWEDNTTISRIEAYARYDSPPELKHGINIPNSRGGILHFWGDVSSFNGFQEHLVIKHFEDNVGYVSTFRFPEDENEPAVMVQILDSVDNKQYPPHNSWPRVIRFGEHICWEDPEDNSVKLRLLPET